MELLRYRISDWHQLQSAMSNTCRDLHIAVDDLVNNRQLGGIRISVIHKDFGTLFSYVVHGSGTLLSDSNVHPYTELSTDVLLAELQRYGFIVDYTIVEHLPGDQLNYLLTLRDLGFDKLRLLHVRDYAAASNDVHLVAFNAVENPDWLANTYAAGNTEFSDALKHGSAVVIRRTAESKWSWDWLDFVANIDDIVRDNA